MLRAQGELPAPLPEDLEVPWAGEGSEPPLNPVDPSGRFRPEILLAEPPRPCRCWLSALPRAACFGHRPSGWHRPKGQPRGGGGTARGAAARRLPPGGALRNSVIGLEQLFLAFAEGNAINNHPASSHGDFAARTGFFFFLLPSSSLFIGSRECDTLSPENAI